MRKKKNTVTFQKGTVTLLKGLLELQNQQLVTKKVTLTTPCYQSHNSDKDGGGTYYMTGLKNQMQSIPGLCVRFVVFVAVKCVLIFVIIIFGAARSWPVLASS